MASSAFLFNEYVPGPSKELIEVLLHRKIIEPNLFENLPKSCPYSDRIRKQRNDLGGQLLLDILATFLGQAAITQRHFPYSNKEDLEKMHNALWPSSFSDASSTMLGHFLTLYLLLSNPEDSGLAEEYATKHAVPCAILALIKAYKFFDLGLYQEFTANLAAYVSYQTSRIKETSRLENDGCKLILKHLLDCQEFKAAAFFAKSFKLELDDSDTLKMLFTQDFGSCLRYARSHRGCLNAFVELCVLPEHEKFTKRLLETPFSPSEVAHVCAHAFEHLQNTRLGNFAFLLMYVNHFYALAIYFHSFFGSPAMLHERKLLVDAMQAKLTSEERARLKQYQREGSFKLALGPLLLLEKVLDQPDAEVASIPEPPAIETPLMPLATVSMKRPLVFRPKPQETVPPLKYMKVTPETAGSKLKKLKSKKRGVYHGRQKNAMHLADQGHVTKEATPMSDVSMEIEEDRGDDTTPLARRRYSLRNRKPKETPGN